MTCLRCQQDNPPQAKFCLECGTPVNGASPSPRSYADLNGEVERLSRALTDSMEQQTATSEILRVISSSPTDLQPVFDAIARNARQLLDGHTVSVIRRIGDEFQLMAFSSMDAAGETVLKAFFPIRLDRIPVVTRLMRERTPVVVTDTEADPEIPEDMRQLSRARGWRSVVWMPMIREDTAIGIIAVSRRERGGFADGEVALLKTFADQAVIAIENVRLFKETKEALEQQTATSEILRVISQSQTDVQPVFNTIVKSAARLCDGVFSTLASFDGELLHLVATHNFSPTALDVAHRVFPAPPSRATIMGRAILERGVVHAPDVKLDGEYGHPALTRAVGWRSGLAVPMLRDGVPLGAIAVGRAQPGPFTDQEIALLQTFADQAVIAIENVRLFSELQEKNLALTEALEQQTATAEILRLIAGSPTDLESVLGTVAETAMRVCGARDAIIYRCDGDVLRLASTRGSLPVVPSSLALPLNEKTVTGRSVVERRTIHVHDLAAVAASEYPEALSRGVAGGSRTVLATPLLQDGEPLGAILIRRGEVQAFTDKQIALLETFADQAVIAIENVRLFTALEARNRDLTATAEILQVISRSPTDLQPAFDTIVRNAANVCGAFDATLALADGEDFVTPAHHGPIPRPSNKISMRGTVTGLAIREARTVHVADLLATEDFPIGKDLARKIGYRTVLIVPLLREGVANGAIGIRRTEVRPFTDAQIALLQTFADQAVIAIENVRLFTELQEKNRALTEAHAQVTEALEQQTATSEILGVISSSPTNVQPVFDAVAQSAARLCEAYDVVIFRREANRLLLVAHHGPTPIGLVGEFSLPLDRGVAGGRAVLDGRAPLCQHE